MCRVAFPMYRLLTATFGGTAVPVGLRADYGTDLAAMAGAVTEDTRIVWLCSPNNPTGLVIRQDEMDAFVARLPDHVVVVYDEPYRDFVTDPSTADGRRYVLAGRPVILVRSFSKSGGLAGLRVGYGIGPPDLIGNLSRTVMPYNTGQVAMIGAAASLDDDAHLQSSRELVWRERAFLQERLSGMGLTCLESQANFLLVVDPPVDAADLAAALLRRGVLVRAMAGFGMENGLRVTVGLREENERFLDALTAVLGEQ